MKNAYEVLYQKEAALLRVRREIESLTIAARLLAEDDISLVNPGNTADEQNRKPVQKADSPEPLEAERTGTDDRRPRSGFWGSFTFRR